MVSTLPQQLLSYLPLSATAPEKIYPMTQDMAMNTTATTIITTTSMPTSPPSLIHRINVSKNASADTNAEPVCELSTIMASSTLDGRQHQAASDSLSVTYVRGLNRPKSEDSAHDFGVDNNRSTALLRTEGAQIRVVRAHVEGPSSPQLSGVTTSDIVNRPLLPSYEPQRRKSIYDRLDVPPAPISLPDLEAPIEESREWALDRMQQLNVNDENEGMEVDHDAMDIDAEMPVVVIHKAPGSIRGTPISLAQLGNRTKALDGLNSDYPVSPKSLRHPIDSIAEDEICDVSSPNGSPSTSPRTSVTDLSQTLNFKSKFSKLTLPLKRSLSINNFRDKSDTNSVMNMFMKKRMRTDSGAYENKEYDDCASEFGETRSVLDRLKGSRRISSYSVLDASNRWHFPRRNGLSRSSTITNDSGRPASNAGSSEFGSEYGDAPTTISNTGVVGMPRMDMRAFRAMFKKAATDIYRSNSYSPSSTKAISRKEMKTIALWKKTVNTLMAEGPSLTEAWMNGNVPTPRSQQIRRFIVQEMYTTEQTYLEHLQIIQKMFMEPFIEAAQSHNPLVNPSDISVIFAHVSDLINLSATITRKLELASQNWREDESRVGQIFGFHEDDFDVYIKFAINFKASQKAIKRADNNNILYRRFIQDALRNKETNRLGLSDYMIIPIQRITRYCLLLRDLKKNTPPTHVDHDDIDAALKSLMGLALAMNDVQKKPLKGHLSL